MPTTLTPAEAKLFLALLDGEVPNLAWIMEGGDPFHNFLEKYGMTEAEFDGLFAKLRPTEPKPINWAPGGKVFMDEAWVEARQAFYRSTDS